MAPTQYNHNINHIAFAVPDLEAACAWYTKHFGFRRIRSDRYTDRSVTPEAPIFRICGASLQKVKAAFLAAGNGVGFELFEFVDPPTEVSGQGREFRYQRGGFYHLAITVPDPEAALARALEDGATAVGEVVQAGGEGDKVLYLMDPWGVTVELLTCSFEQMFGNRG
ncbi:Glyoxalase/Bleomycin resistance protein/Dihydroxybiphenyl dioxygenase [Xylariomycetidae sp. FL2044]|nr:Glyoxalase/Bleomycin resistance protein/Dihydroxybiphenyl dioxygenase [Xylariomycetidae sp. FL2044]